MKLMVCAVMAMSMLACAAHAGDWRVVGMNDSNVTLIDRSSIRATSSVGTTAWVGFIPLGDKEDGIDYTMIRSDFLCRSGMMHLRHVYHYRSDGSVVNSFPMTTATMSPPPPDSVGESLLRAVCDGEHGDEGFESLSSMFTEESKAAARLRRRN